ncbi:MAG: hypothetical protein LBE55_05545 [Clostridiales bacterium]|nr:hypothetical protein [Clostridiales bacterium]
MNNEAKILSMPEGGTANVATPAANVERLDDKVTRADKRVGRVDARVEALQGKPWFIVNE